ncbi:MAG: peptide chain release factor N(5)-glutamine methyltransferase [Clostridia bacterium]|nr:peptide chain release factor N(5)-glutamine methyltransferase [Clostridia bacterium]
MIIKELLKKGFNELKNTHDYMLKAKILLAYCLGESKEYLIIHYNDEVNSKVEENYLKGIQRLKNGEPLQYIIQKAEFFGLEFFVDKNVLIPQPDTEILVEEVLEKFSDKKEILDLCTGSGAIAISLKKNLINSQVYASDISYKALEITKKNAKINLVDINLIKSDLFENIDKKFELIVSNPPYIESDLINQLSLEVQSEPILALDGGKDGLDFYRRIIKDAKKYLKKDGILILEIGFNQKENVINILEKEGYIEIYSKKDYSGNDRIVIRKKIGGK